MFNQGMLWKELGTKMNKQPAMKKYFALFCMALTFIACNKVIISDNIPQTGGTRTVTLNACLPETRVDIDTDSGKVTWSSDDKIAVYNTAGDKFEFSVKSGAGTGNATFECTAFEGEIADIAIYPYKWAGETKGVITIPLYIERTDEKPAVMASMIEGGNGTELNPLYFNSLMAIVEFTLQDIPAYACAFKLWSKNGEALSGNYTVNEECTGVTAIENSSNNSQVIYFPYKSAYGNNASIKIFAAVPAYEYSDLAVRVLDGDEDVIEGTGKVIPAKNFTGIQANAYLKMPSLNVRNLVGDKRDKFVKVEGIKWAKGNLRVKKEDSYEDGWQAGFNIFENQYETVYTEFKTVSYTHTADYYDLFNWGGLGRTTRFGNSGFMTQNDAGTDGIGRLDISGKIFSRRSGTYEEIINSEVSGDERFAKWDVFAGYNGGAGNPNIFGDIAFWASKGQYRMPTNQEIVTLRAANKNTSANAEAGYYMLGDVQINGILLTSTPSWIESSLNTTARELTDADLESGLFLPKTGRRIKGATDMAVNFANAQGYYWSSTFGNGPTNTNNIDFSTSATTIGWRVANSCDYGYTTATNDKIPNGEVSGGLPIRPVFIPENERN